MFKRICQCGAEFDALDSLDWFCKSCLRSKYQVHLKGVDYATIPRKDLPVQVSGDW